jgi:hypothetical protein
MPLEKMSAGHAQAKPHTMDAVLVAPPMLMLAVVLLVVLLTAALFVIRQTPIISDAIHTTREPFAEPSSLPAPAPALVRTAHAYLSTTLKWDLSKLSRSQQLALSILRPVVTPRAAVASSVPAFTGALVLPTEALPALGRTKPLDPPAVLAGFKLRPTYDNVEFPPGQVLELANKGVADLAKALDALYSTYYDADFAMLTSNLRKAIEAGKKRQSQLTQDLASLRSKAADADVAARTSEGKVAAAMKSMTDLERTVGPMTKQRSELDAAIARGRQQISAANDRLAYLKSVKAPRYYVKTAARDAPGWDILHNATWDPKTCGARCDATVGCVGYVTDAGKGRGCWLKNRLVVDGKRVTPARDIYVPGVPPVPVVTVYQHCDYKGLSASLPPGRYLLHDLMKKGVRNDDLSSLKVPAGRTVHLYQHDGFRGRVWTYKHDQPCLVTTGANDVASSIIIE